MSLDNVRKVLTALSAGLFLSNRMWLEIYTKTVDYFFAHFLGGISRTIARTL